MLELPADVDDVVLENAPVRRHQHGGLTIEGYSRAAVQSYWRIPELKIGFDFGLQPWSFMATPTWALTHGHLDHVAALAVYVARRRMMRMPEPTIYMPAEIVEDVQRLLLAFQRLDRGRLPVTIVACQPRQEFDLARNLVLSTIQTSHSVPSLGFMVWERKHKLLEKYAHLTGNEIRDLRLSGVEVTQERRTPLVGYLGDTNSQVFEDHPEVFDAKILITEITFVAASHRSEKIHRLGHIHYDDIIARADRFQNELIIASHFSTRYHDEQVRRMIDKRLPSVLRDRLMVWL